MNGCIADLDGWLCCIKDPSANEVTKVKSYFSEHYQCYGLNVQATCNATCRFTSLSVICPGDTSDSKAFYDYQVYNLVQDLPDGYFVVGDKAYILSSNRIIPYSVRKSRMLPKMPLIFLSQLQI
jgi:hypothetical protein